MPEARWLLMASSATIKKLERTPESIDDLTDKNHYCTYYPCTISFFTTGDAQSLVALSGVDTLECSTVVDGELGIVKPASIAKILAQLAKLDLATIEKQVEAAKPKQLAKQGVDDFDMLEGGGEPRPKLVVSEIERLIAFYKLAAKKKTGVVMYTS